MELSSDNLYAFLLRKYKQIDNKNKLNISPSHQIPSIKHNFLKKEDKKINNSKIIEYFHALIINNLNISNILYNSIDPFINECFNNLEFLSITNNYIKNLDFILYLPNLLFLDLFGNPLEQLTALNNKNIFGYLRLSVESFNEKKILSIFDLQCGIFEIDLKDKTILKTFNSNNHHICMVNNEINYLIEKIKLEEYRIQKRNSRIKINNINYFNSMSLFSKSIGDFYNSDSKTNINNNQIDNNVNIIININHEEKNEYIYEKPKINIVQKNPFLVKIKNFFDDYQSEIYKILQKDKSFDITNSKKIILSNNKNFRSKNYINNKEHLQHEKEKLILIFDIYKKISIFNKEKNDNKYYIGNIYSINVNKIMDSIFVKEIKDNIMNYSQIPRNSIIILISIIFYTIGTISDKMMNALINYILTKYYYYDENKKYPDFSNLGDIHYLSFYYSTYDYIYKRLVDNEKSISIEKYKDILNILQMEKLILQSNYLYKKLKENKSNDNKIEFSNYRNIKINNEIKAIKELDITKEFLVLIEFLCDFIIYEKIEDIVINNSYPGEYSYLIELKETMEETAFQTDNNNFLTNRSLSDLKFQKNKKERLFNKFYFEKDKIKRIKDKEFKNNLLNDLAYNKTLNNFGTNFDNHNSLFKNYNYSNINFQDNEYKKNYGIAVDDVFSTKNKSMNNTNRLFREKHKHNYFSNEKENNCENSLEDDNNENNISINRLPKLKRINVNLQSYEDFDLLKKMILDPHFLSQHARNIIKFEKNKKLLKKLENLHNINKKNYKNNNIYERNTNRTEDWKLNDKEGFLNNNDINIYFSKSKRNYFNRTKTEIKNEISPKNNSNAKTHKTKLNSTSTNMKTYKFRLPNDANSPDKNNEKKIKVSYRDANDFTIKCSKIRKQYKSPFIEIPESFPGITLLNFGFINRKTQLKKNKFNNEKSQNKNYKNNYNKNKKLLYKEFINSKIKLTIKDNILRNARRVSYPIYQSYS